MSKNSIKTRLETLLKQRDEVRVALDPEAELTRQIGVKRAELAAAERAENMRNAEPIFQAEAAKMEEIARLALGLDQAIRDVDALGVQLQVLGLRKRGDVPEVLRDGVKHGLAHWRNWKPELVGLPARLSPEAQRLAGLEATIKHNEQRIVELNAKKKSMRGQFSSHFDDQIETHEVSIEKCRDLMKPRPPVDQAKKHRDAIAALQGKSGTRNAEVLAYHKQALERLEAA